MIRCLGEAHGQRFAAYQGDCVDILAQLPSATVGFAVFSPPFSNLYCYSDSVVDFGNSENDEQFIAHYRFFARELTRVLQPGRLIAVHCKDLPYYKNQQGTAGLRDLPGMLIAAHAD